MSGIVGIINLDGAPIDRWLLGRLTDSLAYRGSDRRATWLDGSVGFGHALLRATVESEFEQQPSSLDGRVWITADARVDGRTELIQELESLGRAAGTRHPELSSELVGPHPHSRCLARSRSAAAAGAAPRTVHLAGRTGLRAASDAELILHAYHAWGEACVEHLIGDFAFGIWDGRSRSLFCARDHFGVKPFYYAHVNNRLVFSNSLDCIRLHPAVGDAFNELAIGDFLLFGFNQDPATTTFADIRRLAPAHCLTSRDGRRRPKRYWTLPTDGRIRYRHSCEYVDHFRELLRAAVGDRLRTDSVGVWMSGGLDSTSITATAQQLLSERSPSFELRAYTTVYDTLIPDEERAYSRVAAEALGIGVSYFVADGYGPLVGWDERDLWTPEPTDEPFLLIRTEQLRQAASGTRVLLCGEGGDEVLWRSDVADLLGKMPLRELGADVVRSLVFHRRRPGVGLRSKLKSRLGNGSERPPYPAWLNRVFADRLDLRARWEQPAVRGSAGDHPLRPEAHRRLAMAFWPSYFESSDPGVTRIPIEARYPFLDVRLVRYLLAIPPIPWCVDKQLLRVAMRGTLPDPIRLRPKAPLGGDQLRAHLRRPDTQWLDRFDPAPELAQYVDGAAVPPLTRGGDGTDPWLNLRPRCLDYWLRRVHVTKLRLEEGISDDDQVDQFQRGWPCQEIVREPSTRGLWRRS